MKKLFLLLTLVAPAATLANGYDVPNVNPRDLALAGSATAAQIDAAAAYQNPAALSRVQGLDVNAALSVLMLGTKWTGPSAGQADLVGRSASTKFSPVPPVSLFAAYGFPLGGRNAALGLGVNVPGGGNVFWKNDWPGRGRIITVDRKVYALYLTGGYELLPKLRVGGGLVYYYGTEYLKQGVQPFPDAYGELSTSGGAPSFDLSAEYELPRIPLTVGVDFKYKATMKLKGNGKFVVPEGLLPDNSQPPLDQSVRHHLTYPSILNVGLAYRLRQPWLLTAGFTWTGYSVYESDVFVGSLGTTITVPRDYGNGYVFRIGAEYSMTPDLTLRAGLLRDQSGLNRDFASPTLPDSNAWAGALGGSYTLRRDLAINAALFYAHLDKVNVTGTETLPGSYRTNVWIASAGVTWHMGER